MYWGASPWIALNAKISNLNSILRQKGNQCEENKVGVIWQKQEREQTSQAALFWICCNLLRCAAGRPYSKPLQISIRAVMNAWTSVCVESLDKYFLMPLMLYRWNDKVLHILFIWQPIFMFSSNHDPKFLTAVTGLIVASPTTNPLMSTLVSKHYFG